jgi:hypothetical protein
MGQLKYFITYYNKYNSKYDFKGKHNTHLTGLYTAWRAAGATDHPPPAEKFNANYIQSV